MNDTIQFDPNNPPPPLMTGEPDSFAYRTMTTRFPTLVQNVLADHVGRYPTSIVQAVQALHDELGQNQPVRPLETSAPDGADWAKAWQRYAGRTWLDIPWYFAEAFFFRRLLEAMGYFGGQGEEWIGFDPFLPRKQAELQSEVTWRVLATALHHAPDNSADSFRALLHHCLWGNRVDLSYTQVTQASGRQITVANEQANLLVDNTEEMLAHLRRRGGEEARRRSDQETLSHRLIARFASLHRIDFICDNAGTELLLDLALVDFLLRFGWAGQVILHVKAHPTYVSDATPDDISLTIEAIKSQPAGEFTMLASRLESFQAQRRLHIRPNLFWNSSHFFWEIPPILQSDLSQAYLVIIKGDANYRRLLGDSRWPTTTPITMAVPYFPTSFVALRTLKSDPIVGLPPGLAERLEQEDPEWRVNGRRGMIQFVIHPISFR